MNKILLSAVAILAVFGIANFVVGYIGDAPKVVVEGNYIEAEGGEFLGGFFSPDISGQTLRTVTINKTNIYSTTTLNVSDSGQTYM